MHIAAKNGHHEIISMLIAFGADVNASDEVLAQYELRNDNAGRISLPSYYNNTV
jgi:ankyrin repeat protein